MDRHDPIHRLTKRVNTPSKGNDTGTIPRVHTLDLRVNTWQNGVEQLLSVVTTGNVRPGERVETDQVRKHDPAGDVDGEKAGDYLEEGLFKGGHGSVDGCKEGQECVDLIAPSKEVQHVRDDDQRVLGPDDVVGEGSRPKSRVVASHTIQNSIVFPELLNWLTNRSTPAKRSLTNTTK